MTSWMVLASTVGEVLQRRFGWCSNDAWMAFVMCLSAVIASAAKQSSDVGVTCRRSTPITRRYGFVDAPVVHGATMEDLTPSPSTSELSGGKFANGAVTGAMQGALKNLANTSRVGAARQVAGAQGGIDAPTEELQEALKVARTSNDVQELNVAVRTLVTAATEFFGIDLDPSKVLLNPSLKIDAFASANQIELSRRPFESFGALGSTLIHELVHFNVTIDPASLAGRIQEIQALQAEITNAGLTGINVGPIQSQGDVRLQSLRAESPSAFRAVQRGDFESAFRISQF